MNDNSPPATDTRPPPDDTAGQLIAAGRTLFAERGYDGTSVRALTTLAGANLGAVTYHFGSKEGLYHEVLRRAVAPLQARVEAALARKGGSVERLTGVVEAYFEHFSRHPELPRLLVQEVAAGRVPPPPVTGVMKAITARVADVVREGQAHGEVRAAHPLLMVLSLISQPIYLVLMQRPLREVLGMDLEDDRTRSLMMDHLLAFARAGIQEEDR
ncbi:MAG: TetR/AcrR family transcriptional regulator [Longimicrobiales bacterium]|nr:TetR/AcrR family transcriptional regulator [Longimicrobiales bacterium]